LDRDFAEDEIRGFIHALWLDGEVYHPPTYVTGFAHQGFSASAGLRSTPPGGPA
jgi:hypothetical protein